MEEMEKLPNIGKVIAGQLRQSGISSPRQLAACGSEAAWLRIRGIDESACINKLYALEGAIRGVRRYDLPEEVKDRLRAFYLQNKR